MHALRMMAVVAGALASSASAQVPPAEIGQRNVPAPWWMRDPVIASMGQVRAELPANRATFSASFASVERTVEEASRRAAEKVRALDSALRGFGAERVRLTTTLATRPLYEQVRLKDGSLIDNQRPDAIDRYEATASIDVEVRDLSVLERAYAQVVGARPTTIGRVGFDLQPTNEVRSWLAGEAVKDAARRARSAAIDAGARLGSAKVIDPTGGVCRTEVLAGWPSYATGGRGRTTVEPPASVTAYSIAAPSPPALSPPPATSAQSLQLTLNPPRQTIESEACIVYALLP